MFKHFLITRFNLKKKDWNTNKKNQAVLTEEWHENRFKLFSDYCFPSVASQTNKNFIWYVFFDTSTSEKYRKIITQLQTKLPNFTPIFINGMDAFLPEIKKTLAPIKESHIITTGLDNDDCISNLFIDEIQKKFNNQDFLALDFINGYTLQISPNIKLGKKLHLYNPFISLIEKNDNPITVCNVSHRLWKREKRILQIRNNPIWSSVIHLENKVNEFTGYGNITTNHFFDRFTVEDSAKELIIKNNTTSKQWFFVSLYNRVTSHWNVIFKSLKKNLGFYNN